MFAKLAVLSAAVASAVAQITINTPVGATGAIQCAVYQVTWTGGTGPFDIRLLDSAQNFVEEVSENAASSPVQWTVNQPAGQVFLFSIHDSQGVVASTGQFTIQQSGNSGCLGVTSGASSAASTAASTTASSSASSVVSTTSIASSSSAVASSSVASTSSAAVSSVASQSSASRSSSTASSPSSSGSSTPSASQTPGGALANAVAPAGIFGALVAALFALAA